MSAGAERVWRANGGGGEGEWEEGEGRVGWSGAGGGGGVEEGFHTGILWTLRDTGRKRVYEEDVETVPYVS